MSRVPDYIEDVLSGLNPFVKIELLRLIAEETTTKNVIQKRYRSKDNRQKFISLGLVLQLYKDIITLETE